MSTRLRPSKISSDDESEDMSATSSPSIEQTYDHKEDLEAQASELASADGDELDAMEPDDHDNEIQENLNSISFGVLADAQAELARDQRRDLDRHKIHDKLGRTDVEKINTLRERLAELKKVKAGGGDKSDKTAKHRSSNLDGGNTFVRSSKHAPTEQSSRRAVTRKRSVLDVAQDPYHSRDPRFAASSSSANHPRVEAMRKNYAFLNSYRENELKQLKEDLNSIKARKKKRKSKALTEAEENETVDLRRQINSIENKIKAEAEKERLRDVARRHKKEEKELVKQGKNPYYLKNSELKQRALKEHFQSMKAKDRDKAVERRKKKLSHRERKSMPAQRRTLE